MTKGRTYRTEKKYVSFLNKEIKSKCPYCGHTMMRSVKYKWLLCDHCWRKYENNSKAYKIKKIKEMLKSEI